MDVSVHDRLACCLPIVHPNVESIRMKLLHETGTDDGNQFPERLPYLGGEIEDARDVLSRDDQCVARRYGKSVKESQPALIADPYSGGFELAKRTVHMFLRFRAAIIIEPAQMRKCNKVFRIIGYSG